VRGRFGWSTSRAQQVAVPAAAGIGEQETLEIAGVDPRFGLSVADRHDGASPHGQPGWELATRSVLDPEATVAEHRLRSRLLRGVSAGSAYALDDGMERLTLERPGGVRPSREDLENDDRVFEGAHRQLIITFPLHTQ
jgi:hypothetical protein